MQYIVRVTEYHYGGHGMFVVLVEDGYRLTSCRSNASIFNSSKQLVDIRDYLVNNGKRTIEMEQIVNNKVLDQLAAI